MNPLELTLDFFGPFEHETVDFTRLAADGMFLISGATGAGKSTIFDGLVFALYGDASGQQRKVEEFRSEFATPTDQTQVTLSFTLDNKLYRIIRKPAQTVAKKRGEGTTEQAAKVELTIYRDETGQIEEKQFTLAKKVGEYLLPLLKLNAAQFRQIVLLPQGEFRTFLNGDSNEKEAVLRQLFQTGFYQQWMKQVQEVYKTQQQQNRETQVAIKSNLAEVQWEENWQPGEDTSITAQRTALQQQINDQSSRQRQQQSALLQNKKLVEQRQQELTAAQQVQGLFDERQELEDTRIELTDKKTEISNRKQQLDQQLWAQQQAPIFESYQKNQQLVTQRQQELVNSLQAESTIVAQRQQFQENQVNLDSQATKFEELQTKIVQVATTKPLYQQVATLLQQSQQQEERFSQQQAAYNQQVTVRQDLQSKYEQLLAQQVDLNELYETKIKLTAQQQQASAWQQQLADIIEMTSDNDELTAEIKRQEQVQQQTQQQLYAAQQTYQLVKSQFAQEQIIRLSQDLLPGEPCPVCGSLEHPQLAQVIKPTHSISELQVNDADDQRQKLEQQVERKQAHLMALQTQETKNNREIGDQRQNLIASVTTATWAVLPKSLTDDAQLQVLIETQERQIEVNLQTNATAQLLQQQRTEQLEQWQQQLTTGQADLVTKQNQLSEQKAVVEKTTQQLTDARAGLPAEFETLADLTAFLTISKQKLSTYREKVTQTRLDLQQTNEQLAMNKNDQTHINKQLTELKKEITMIAQKLRVAFSVYWPTATLDEQLEQFVALSQNNSNISTWQAEINAYQTAVTANEALRQQNTNKLADASEPDILLHEQQLTIAQTAADALQEKVHQLDYQIQRGQESTAFITAELAKVKDLTELQELSEVMSGANETKLGLERYVLQRYLEEVLKHANVRLIAITGRYQLKLAQVAGSGRNSTGLELNVFDDYTGDIRSVRTLSGGESFIAALCLALALGEVVQEQTGSVDIKTLFVDEGFGSLDEQALKQALNTLTDIQGQQRLIGIISHVAQLKEQIPTQLQVIPQGDGRSKISYQLNDNRAV